MSNAARKHSGIKIGLQTPRERRTPSTRRRLTRIRNALAATARLAGKIGIDAIDVHAARGYLLHQFLLPWANFRTDNYGGSFHARMRFPLEGFEAVREAAAGGAQGMRIHRLPGSVH